MQSNKKLVSVIIRTLNEERYLNELLQRINDQHSINYDIEVVIVDSGSTDKTLDIAERWQARITHINKDDFSFGRSLNIGCRFSKGQFLVFISGHCIPVDSHWIERLITPLEDQCVYTYGRQIGRDSTKYSERQLFQKYFPEVSRIPQAGFFVNNANSAIRRDVWERFLFDEELTGCEDMYLARQIVNAGQKLGYVAEAPVYHIHDETWQRVAIRYEREAIALQRILPEIHINFLDMCKYIIVGILKDSNLALQQRVFFQEFKSIIRFRIAQYLGAYRGNRSHRILSTKMKAKYFYPRVSNMDIE